MRRSLSRRWRQLRTGLCFVYYGLGAVALSLALTLREAVAGHDADLAQRWVRGGYASFIGLAERLGVLRIRTRGMEALAGPGPRLIVANHPSLIDAALIVRHLPQADCFVSPGWAAHPLLRRLVRATEALVGEGPRVVEQAAARLRAGRSVVMFPEGTRSPHDGLGRFQRGAAHVALASGCDLLPVMIRIDPPTTKKGQPWYDVPDRPIDVELAVMPPLSPSKVLDGTESAVLAARKVTAALRESYERVLERG